MNTKIRILNKTILLFIIFLCFIFNLNCSYAYKNEAFSIEVPSKYMGKDCISTNTTYGLGEDGNFLFLTEKNTTKNKISDIKKELLKDVKLNAKLYGKEKIFYKLKAVKINNNIAFTYQIDTGEVYYDIPTDNYIIYIQILSNDNSSPYDNVNFMNILNKIKIIDSVNTIDYNESTLTVVNWDFALKFIIPSIIVIAITVGIIILIKKKKNNN